MGKEGLNNDPADEYETIRVQIRTLDDAEARGVDVTAARTYWCRKAVDWARFHLGNKPKRSKEEDVIVKFLRTIFRGFTQEDIELVRRTCERGPLEHPAKKLARVTADMLSEFSVLPADKEADEALGSFPIE